MAALDSSVKNPNDVYVNNKAPCWLVAHCGQRKLTWKSTVGEAGTICPPWDIHGPPGLVGVSCHDDNGSFTWLKLVTVDACQTCVQKCRVTVPVTKHLDSNT